MIVDEIPYHGEQGAPAGAHWRAGAGKTLEGISDGLRDESDKSGMRMVIELKRGEVPDVVLNNLFKMTQLETALASIWWRWSMASRAC